MGWGWKFDTTNLPFSLKSQASLLLLSILNKRADVSPLLFFNCLCWCARQQFQWDANGVAHTAIMGALWAAQHELCFSQAFGSTSPALQRGQSISASLPPYQRDALTVRKTAGRITNDRSPHSAMHITSFPLTVNYYISNNQLHSLRI